MKRNSTGSVALAALLLLLFFSHPTLRRLSYTLFYASHILLASTFALFIVMHWNKANLYLLPTTSLYLLLLSYRLLLRVKVWRAGCYTRVVGNVKVSSNLYKLIIRKPDHSRFYPGQYVNIKTTLDRWYAPSHPFTIASSPTDGNIRIYYRASKTDFCRNLRRSKSSSKSKLIVDGYYGKISTMETLRSFVFNESAKVVMIAGGVGVTPYLSLLRSLGDIPSGRDSHAGKVELLWSVREREFLDELKGDLLGKTLSPLYTRSAQC